ncbi:right-handed parallel beta-helix repeat-containing protein [Dongshaea marina]|uniref:right-handed parallel beta-helix repeat-containing protein n=1 Tax=Dongshaea marina TaxID=2047966 RepID=UPI000D3E1E6C|nr:right-handed parallel beta-helix repeat-containing protein [Dongshaea marina]
MKRLGYGVLTLSALLVVGCSSQRQVAIAPLAQPSAAHVIYVNQKIQSSDQTGASWQHAYSSLQQALQQAKAGDQIWVAEGTYYPTTGTDRDLSFKLVKGVSLYGGFDGSETKLSQRDWQDNKTILSGNIGDKHSADDNSYHVVIGANQAVLDGFIIADGHAFPSQMNQGKAPANGKSQNHTSPQAITSGPTNGVGAGLLNYQAATLVRNTLFRDNQAMKGGAVYNMTSTSARPEKGNPIPVFINVTFESNFAKDRGGAVSNDLGTNPIFINSLFIKNSTSDKGGALYNDFVSSPLLINTDFENNRAARAAAIGNDGSSRPVLVNVSIHNNLVRDQGAGIYQGSYNVNLPDSANISYVINSSISGNRSQTHGAPEWVNWGQDGIKSWNSSISGWSYGNNMSQTKQQEFAPLVSLSQKLAKLPADQISPSQLEELSQYIQQNVPAPSGNVLSRALNTQPGFGIDEPVIKEVSVSSRIVYVNANGKNTQVDGKSWNTAYHSLQAALKDASNGGAQIWLAQGTYIPSKADRSVSFVIPDKVAVYGGFQGNETKLSQRNWQKYHSILSGNIGSLKSNTDNSYHVVIGSKGALLDGVTVEDGYADGESTNGYGGGLFAWGYDHSLLVKNSLFKDNYAREGGAAFFFLDSRSSLQNVTFSHNSAEYGGAVAARFGSDIEIDNSTFSGNHSDYRGGALLINYGSNVKVKGTLFTDNRSEGNGGAIWIDDQASQYGGTYPVISSSMFANNSAGYYGGAIHNFNKANLTVKDSSFSGNLAKYGSAIANTLGAKLTLNGNLLPSGAVYQQATTGAKQRVAANS